MAKQGQHNDDAHDYDKSKGPNNPEKSVEVTTGSTKNQETYAEQASNHQDTGKAAQHANRDWNEDTRDKPSNEGSTRARDSDLGSGKSGSESNRS